MCLGYHPAANRDGSKTVLLDLINDGTWAHSGDTASFMNWAIKQPDPTGQQCTVVRPHGEWNDVDCSVPSAFLCERD